MQSYEIIKEYKSFDTNFNNSDSTLTILKLLEKVIKNNVDGDIVEMGCHRGFLLYHIRLLLNKLNCNKELYGVDSFEGLPELDDIDIVDKTNPFFKKGDMKCDLEDVYKVFKNLKKPKLLKGFFNKIDKLDYPKRVCFSHFDGDLYSSIMDSFEIIYPRLENGGVIVVDDYNFIETPGVKKACKEFLKNKIGYSYTEHGKLIYVHSNKPLI